MFFVLGVLGWFTVLLSGILIVNTITALMSQQTRQIGIMKAIGGRTHQIFGMYVVLILFWPVLFIFLCRWQIRPHKS
jgi:putative ABC transport system permease protein